MYWQEIEVTEEHRRFLRLVIDTPMTYKPDSVLAMTEEESKSAKVVKCFTDYDNEYTKVVFRVTGGKFPPWESEIVATTILVDSV